MPGDGARPSHMKEAGLGRFLEKYGLIELKADEGVTVEGDAG